ncbi:MAG: class I SAM-dependent methyltransferase [Desulfovibrionaceae bacterium]|jgi:SAM-dependent methyltransferase|nr:class I SAM-dependent methyltransferase [Desulfovibrionaceae bacterium]
MQPPSQAHIPSQPYFKTGARERLAGPGPVRVELGCGPVRTVPGAVTMDIFDCEAVDVVADLSHGIPLDDASVDEVHSHHFLEHVPDLAAFLAEVHRVLRPGGLCAGTVPHFSNPYFYSDPTHRVFFGLYTFNYFSSSSAPFKRRVPHYLNATDFAVEGIELVFRSPFKGRNLFKRAVGWAVNRCRYTREFYEENFCHLVPAYEIRFALRKRA